MPKSPSHIQVQEAKARFSEVIERASEGETIIVTKHGKEAVAILDIETYRQLIKPKKNLLEVLQDVPEDLSALIAPRDKTPHRPRVRFED